MDRRMKPVHVRQGSASDSRNAPSSPMNMSPLYPRHVRTGSNGMPNMKKAQAKAAAQRLAQVMSHQPDDDDDDDELSFDYNPSGFGSIGLAGGRRMGAKSPLSASPARFRVPAKTYQTVDDDDDKNDLSLDYSPANVSLSIGRPGGNATRARSPKSKSPARFHVPAKTYQTVDEDDDQNDLSLDYSPANVSLSIGRPGVKVTRARSPKAVHTRQQQTSPVPSSFAPPSRPATPPDQPVSARTAISGRTSSAELPQRSHSPLLARSSTASTEQLSNLSPISARSSNVSMDQPSSVRSSFSTRPAVKTVTMPASVPLSVRPVSAVNSSDVGVKRLSLDMGSMNFRDKSNQHSASALQDEIDMLQEENETFLEKLRLAEERFEESDARARQLEKQVASLGEGVTLEAKLLSRKEVALQHREAALRIAEQTSKTALRTEAETAKVEATSALEQLHEALFEVKSLRNITQRMILTQEEMEEVVMKRCWLSRYWSLCVQHGIQADIAELKYEYWSSLAPEPAEVVLAAGQRAKDENSLLISNPDEREAVLQDGNDLAGDRNIESFLFVEKGLKELSSLKIEDSVALSMALQRWPNFTKPDEVKIPSEGHYDEFELSEEESDDVRFKQAWLMYFWRRAKNHEVESDLAEERLQFWINHSARSSTSHDAVDVERGLVELRKLGIEKQLWQDSRREFHGDSNLS